jgi:hypothetical protein
LSKLSRENRVPFSTRSAKRKSGPRRRRRFCLWPPRVSAVNVESWRTIISKLPQHHWAKAAGVFLSISKAQTSLHRIEAQVSRNHESMGQEEGTNCRRHYACYWVG